MPRRKNVDEDAEDAVKSKKRHVQNKDKDEVPKEQDDQEYEDSQAFNGTEDEDLLSMKIPERPPVAMSTDPNVPRLIIKEIVVENFKSYYGKQTLGPFHKNFTAVLGPNGSGKSNVIDALLFVFAFRANKIRSRRIALLIHNSTAHSNVRSCTVIVRFAKIIDKGDTCETLPGSEFTISRSVNRSGKSDYCINGRSSTMADVRKMLKANGIDLDHNRFLILQGEVEQISMMKPKRTARTGEDGMLEYLEDIIGSSRLNAPIEKFKRKLDEFVNQEEQMVKKLTLAETEVHVLIKPVRETIKLIRFENQITLCKHKIQCIHKLEAQEERRDMEKRLGDLKGKRGSLEEQYMKCGNRIKDTQAKKAGRQKEQENLQEKIDEFEKQRHDTVLEQRTNIGEIKVIENRKAKREAEIKKERKNLEDAEAAPDKANEAIREYQEAIERLRIEIEQHETSLEELRIKERETNQANRLKLEDILPEVTNLNAEESEWNRALEIATIRLDGMLASANDPQNQLRIAEEQSKKLEYEIDASKESRDRLSGQLPALVEEIRKNEEIIVAQRKKEEDMISRMNYLQREVEAGRRDASISSSNSATLNSLMDEKKNKRIPGILGRLGDLGGIDTHYDVAISTCCPQLDNIVVDTVETAQQCIAFLRDNNLARITFIALDKQQHFFPRILNKPVTPENASRIVDLITVTDNNIKPAFYSVLRDTLFAETIEDAARISGCGDKRWRVVTANGELVETSGTMTGGGRNKIRGRMGKKVRIDTSHSVEDQDWQNKEQELNVVKENLNKVRVELSNIMDRVKNQKEDCFKMEREFRNLEANIPRLCQQYERTKDEVKKALMLVQTVQVDQGRIEDLKNEIKNFEREKEDVRKRAQDLRQQKDKLETTIKKIEDKILGRTRDKLKDLKDEREQAEKNCKNEQLELKNSASTISRIKRNIQKAEEAIQEAESELVRANERSATLARNVEARNNEIEECKERRKKMIEETEQAVKDVEELNKERERLRTEIEQQDVGIAAVERQMKSQDEKLEDIDAAIGKLTLYSIRGGLTFPSSNPATRGHEPQPPEDDSVVESPHDQNAIDEHGERAQSSMDVSESELDGPAHDVGTLSQFGPEEVREFDEDEIQEAMNRIERRKAGIRGKINLSLIEDYAEKLNKRDDVAQQMEDLKVVHAKHRKKYHELVQMRDDEFNDGFQRICIATQEIYQMLTLGGDAALEKVNTMNTFKDGITYQVRPPKKTWKQIINLSGGEKTLASLALVFGLHKYRPTPLYVMDEIDASLDYRNVSVVSSYLKERTKNAQFIVISLRNNMSESADRFLGIYKTNDCTGHLVHDDGNMA